MAPLLIDPCLLPIVIPLTWRNCRRFFRWRWGGGIFKAAHCYYNHGNIECISSEPLDPNKKYIISWYVHLHVLMCLFVHVCVCVIAWCIYARMYARTSTST